MAGTELFIEDHMVLCFAILTKKVMINVSPTSILAIAEYCFCLLRLRVFSVSHAAFPVSRLGVHKSLGRDIAGTAVPS